MLHRHIEFHKHIHVHMKVPVIAELHFISNFDMVIVLSYCGLNDFGGTEHESLY